MTPFFSVIIPLYNKEHYIKATLHSVLKQTFLDAEIIIINDGSTDNSLAVAEEVLNLFEMKTIISQKNKGLSATRNKAISIAKGKVIALLDADDLWKPSYLKTLHQLALQFPEAHLFGTDYVEFYSEKIQLKPKKNLTKQFINTSFLVSNFFKASLHQPITVPSSFAFKRDVFNTITFNETVTFAEDIEFYIKTNLAFKMAFNYTALVVSRQDIPNQMTKVGFKGKKLPNLDIFDAFTPTHKYLKTYLNTYRYFFLLQCRVSNDNLNAQLLYRKLDSSQLTIKQQFLLKCPLFVLNWAKHLKSYALTKKLKLTSY